MPDAKYYRDQAKLCVRLALTASDPQSAARYNDLALEYLLRADELETQAAAAESDAAESRPIGTDEMGRD